MKQNTFPFFQSPFSLRDQKHYDLLAALLFFPTVSSRLLYYCYLWRPDNSVMCAAVLKSFF